MSGIMNLTNLNRIEKMQEIVGHIGKSIASNKATDHEVEQLFAPLMVSLVLQGVMKTAPVPDAAPEATTAPPQTIDWITIREVAQQASLADLTTAMAVYLSRLDEELHK
jgi:hypothetical protein